MVSGGVSVDVCCAGYREMSMKCLICGEINDCQCFVWAIENKKNPYKDKPLTLRAYNAAHYRRNRAYKDTDGCAYEDDCWMCRRFNRLLGDERNKMISEANVYDKQGYIDTVLEGELREPFEMLKADLK